MAISINDNLSNGGVQPNLDFKYGPYVGADITEAKTAAHNALYPYGYNVIGLTVALKVGSTVTEYWYQGGTDISCLVPKQSNVDGVYFSV